MIPGRCLLLIGVSVMIGSAGSQVSAIVQEIEGRVANGNTPEMAVKTFVRQESQSNKEKSPRGVNNFEDFERQSEPEETPLRSLPRVLRRRSLSDLAKSFEYLHKKKEFKTQGDEEQETEHHYPAGISEQGPEGDSEIENGESNDVEISHSVTFMGGNFEQLKSIEENATNLDEPAEISIEGGAQHSSEPISDKERNLQNSSKQKMTSAELSTNQSRFINTVSAKQQKRGSYAPARRL